MSSFSLRKIFRYGRACPQSPLYSLSVAQLQRRKQSNYGVLVSLGIVYASLIGFSWHAGQGELIWLYFTLLGSTSITFHEENLKINRIIREKE